MISGWSSWRMTFGLLAGCGLIILLAILRMFPSIPGGEGVTFKQQFAVFKNIKVITGYMVTLCWGAGYSAAYTFVAPYLQTTLDMDTKAISMTMFVLGFFPCLAPV